MRRTGDDVHVDAGSVSATISSATGGNFENLLVDRHAAVTAISDTIDTTTVSLTATPSVAEGGTAIIYTATLTSRGAGDPVTVTLDNGAGITIAGRRQTSGAVERRCARRATIYVDGDQRCRATISGATGGNFESLVRSTRRRPRRDHRHDRHHHGER